ncbi:putative glutathione S-transferase [Lindgomyces ingoldianus]|uniref:Glutathione S-transferase n=1 Tax=Lindgomyces ingoldianus TaxID=673940 RepID=A0ACB6QSM1_9PLEO|nr:putative glutathione S-transferase [Lindgomyces ingoldianus]KAF2469176.1 putative glutathione S-transferase [Lindgomyces ingoldianus]
MHLYESIVPSGNAYKVRLLLSHLGIEYETTFLDILTTPPETRKPEFLAINPNGRIPVLILDDGTPLAESNAILFYLSEGTKFLSESKLGRAKILQWLFFEQYSHEPYVAVWKFLTYWGDFSDRSESEVEKLRQRGQEALDVMERHLEGKKFFVDDAFSIADIALYAYTSAAEVVGFQVDGNVRAWLKRVEEQDGHVKIRKDPTGKCPL